MDNIKNQLKKRINMNEISPLSEKEKNKLSKKIKLKQMLQGGVMGGALGALSGATVGGLASAKTGNPKTGLKAIGLGALTGGGLGAAFRTPQDNQIVANELEEANRSKIYKEVMDQALGKMNKDDANEDNIDDYFRASNQIARQITNNLTKKASREKNIIYDSIKSRMMYDQENHTEQELREKFLQILKKLNDSNMLSPKGKKVLARNFIDKKFRLTSDMVNEPGKIFMDRLYKVHMRPKQANATPKNVAEEYGYPKEKFKELAKHLKYAPRVKEKLRKKGRNVGALLGGLIAGAMGAGIGEAHGKNKLLTGGIGALAGGGIGALIGNKSSKSSAKINENFANQNFPKKYNEVHDYDRTFNTIYSRDQIRRANEKYASVKEEDVAKAEKRLGLKFRPELKKYILSLDKNNAGNFLHPNQMNEDLVMYGTNDKLGNHIPIESWGDGHSYSLYDNKSGKIKAYFNDVEKNKFRDLAPNLKTYLNKENKYQTKEANIMQYDKIIEIGMEKLAFNPERGGFGFRDVAEKLTSKKTNKKPFDIPDFAKNIKPKKVKSFAEANKSLEQILKEKGKI